MPHIHTAPGQIDFTAGVFIVYENKVLLRLHDKYKLWLMPGGHIELDEVPEDAAVREVKEEVGLDVVLWRKEDFFASDPATMHIYRELIPPVYMNVHRINDTHRHVDLVYFATSDTDKVIEPENHERSGGCRWFTREEILTNQDIEERVKRYSLKALDQLSK